MKLAVAIGCGIILMGLIIYMGEPEKHVEMSAVSLEPPAEKIEPVVPTHIKTDREIRLELYDSLARTYEKIAYGDILFGMKKAEVQRCTSWKGGRARIGDNNYRIVPLYDHEGNLYQVTLELDLDSYPGQNLALPVQDMRSALDEKYEMFRIDQNPIPSLQDLDYDGSYLVGHYVMYSKDITLSIESTYRKLKCAFISTGLRRSAIDHEEALKREEERKKAEIREQRVKQTSEDL